MYEVTPDYYFRLPLQFFLLVNASPGTLSLSNLTRILFCGFATQVSEVCNCTSRAMWFKPTSQTQPQVNTKYCIWPDKRDESEASMCPKTMLFQGKNSINSEQASMFEDSSDEELCLPQRRATVCWECGKYFRDQEELMDHYRRHSVSATCHMCRVTFQRQISLSIHLDNVHSPPICQKCSICFINSEELNKHAETDCKGQLCPNVPSVKLETQCSSHYGETANAVLLQDGKDVPTDTENSGSFVEYIVGEEGSSFKNECSDEDAFSDLEEESSCSEMGFGDVSVVTQKMDSKVNQTDQTQEKPCPINNLISVYESEMFGCDKRNLFYCIVCRNSFLNEQSHNAHLRALYTCQLCEQVFFTPKLHSLHECSCEDRKSCLTMFCLKYGPKQCKICKAFFLHGKALQQHINKTHRLVINLAKKHLSSSHT